MLDNKTIVMTLIYLSFLLISIGLAVQVSEEMPTVSDLLAKYLENQSKITKCQIFGEASNKSGSSVGDERFWKTKSELRYDGNRVDLQYSTWANLDGPDEDIKSIDVSYFNNYIWDGTNSYDYTRGKSSGNMAVHNSDAMKGPQLSGAYDGAPLLGIYHGDDLSVGVVLQKAANLELRKDMEKVNNFKCYVVDALTPYGKYALWINPEHGYNIAKAEVRKGEKDLVWNGETLLRENRAGTMTGISFSYETLGFGKINDIWMPMEAKYNYNRTYENAAFSYTYVEAHFKRTKVMLNPNFEEIGAFIPTEVQEGDAVYYIDELSQEVDENARPVSMIGEPLLELKTFNIELSMEDIADRKILVCFFDYEQRPSRNAIQTLSKRAQTLLDKNDVYMVFIHAGAVEEQKIASWLKRNEIQPPVGVSRDGLPELGYTWGVESLPWLILTDAEHIVKAEGFGLDELSIKIGE